MADYRVRQCAGMQWAGLLAKFGNDRKAVEDNRGEELECYCSADYSNIYTLFSRSTQLESLNSADPNKGTQSWDMSEDLSSQPWSINKDDYELQEVLGECVYLLP